MTSDAKIGLLLGLVFIIVIAFIINGLPSLRPQTGKAEVTTNMASRSDGSVGIADKEQMANRTISWNDLIDTQQGEPQEPETLVQAIEPSGVEPDSSTAGGPGDMPDENIRNVLPLPKNTLAKFTRGLEDVVRSLAEASAVSGGMQPEKTTTERAPAVEVPKPAPERVQPAPSRPTAPLTPGIPAAVGRTYTVVDGDNLANVAKKVYGAEEGNRVANIQRIFEANRNMLKSPHELRIGQELVIPPLPKAKAVEPRPDTVLPKNLFDEVKEVGRREVSRIEKKAEPRQTSAERWYVVQDGDNLWRIAATQLGSGARYPEILKLNADTVKDKEVLDIGMKLRLPSQ